MKNTKKILQQILISVLFIISSCNIRIFAGAAPGNFGFSPEELKSLNLNEKEAQELEKFAAQLNQMDPKELEGLQKLAEELEAQMKEKGLDPNNPDDIFKWIDEEAQREAQKLEKGDKKVEKSRELQEDYIPKVSKQEEISVVVPTEDTLKVLQGIEKDLAKIRQKSENYETLKHKLSRWHLELSRLTFYIHVLQQKDLLKHLASQDFTGLRKSLEKLYAGLAKYEPQFKVRKIASGDEDPYEILGLPYTANQHEIKKAYINLKNTIHPNVVAKKLEQEQISEKAKNKKIKEARLSFRFIQDAYESLADPKNKAVLDRMLEDKIVQQEILDQDAQIAFNKIINQISNSIYQDGIISQIETLLEKYKPEELEKAKKQEEIEKKVFERSKEVRKITPSARGFEQTQDPYEEFYRHLAQQDWQRQIQRYYPQNYGSPSYAYPSGGGESYPQDSGQKEGTPSKSKGGKKGDKKDKDGGDEKDKGGKPEKPSPERDQKTPEGGFVPEIKLKDKDVKSFDKDIKKLDKLLDGVKDEIEVDEIDLAKPSEPSTSDAPDAPAEPTDGIDSDLDPSVKRSKPEIKTKKVKMKCDKIISDFKDSLKKDPLEVTRSKSDKKDLEPATRLVTYFTKNKIAGDVSQADESNYVWYFLNKVAKIEMAQFNSKLADAWRKLYDKHNAKIKSWYENVNKSIDEKETYSIDELTNMKIKSLRKDLKEIYNWFNSISKKLIGKSLEDKPKK